MRPRDSINRERSDANRHEQAEITAIAALTFLAGDETRLERFLALSGLTPQTLREAAGDAGFLAGVLEHLLNDESLLQAFAANSGADPAEVATAHRILTRG